VQGAAWGDEDVAAQVDGDGLVGFVACGGGGGSLLLRMRLADEVAADDDVVLDYGFAGEDYVLGCVQLGAAGDFVAVVLGMGEGRLVGGLGEIDLGGGGIYGTVSMYSPVRVDLGGMVMADVW
jgi:hypothetical protein